MKCQICNINEAEIVFTQIVENEKIVMQICSECARKKGLSIEISAVEPSTNGHDSFFDLFAGSDRPDDEALPDITCESCGLSFKEFKKNGLFGCDRCHEYFGENVKKLLRQIHGTDMHRGSTEPPAPKKKKVNRRAMIRNLRVELEKCLRMEEYERAAELRDKITVLQKGES